MLLEALRRRPRWHHPLPSLLIRAPAACLGSPVALGLPWEVLQLHLSRLLGDYRNLESSMSCFPIGVRRLKGGWSLLHDNTFSESCYCVIIIQLYIESHLNECIGIFQ
jgi:hypothetical protein